jgi:hypothetical protein
VSTTAAFEALVQNRCTPACAAAINDEDCTCACGGRYHGEVWRGSQGRSTPLNFGMSPNKHSDRYGGRYWMVGLPDGREMGVMADECEVVNGALLLWCASSLTGPRDEFNEPTREPRPRELNLALPAGGWLHIYAASVLTGDPVAIDNLPEPRGARR